MKRGLSGGSLLSSSSSNADAVIAKINQRLDMLTQLEGGMKGGRSDRYGAFPDTCEENVHYLELNTFAVDSQT